MVKVGRGRGRGYSVICNDNPMRDEKMINLRGKFIVLDGNEGCGKSTQSEMLRAALASAGLDVLAVRDPGSTRIGE
ncbi:MAG: tmk, partial [Phycisphaerales bacterium]|nr:tmk [Phycisphaerales bacterium]